MIKGLTELHGVFILPAEIMQGEKIIILRLLQKPFQSAAGGAAK